MKRILLLAAALLGAMSAAFADNISRQQADTYAKQFFGTSTVQFVADSEPVATKSAPAEDPAFYIYNNPNGGWVIISGDESTKRVLGWSDTGSFRTDNMPSNLKYWLDGTREVIRTARANGIETAETSSVRARLVRKASTDSKVLTTATWDQDSPYNNYCPTISGETKRSVTGCVATAMAIVMRYNEWPNTATGTTEAYKVYGSNSDGSYSSKVVYNMPAVTLEGHTYNWSNMPTDGSKTSSWTDEQKKEIATLMYHCGAAVQMQYSYTYGSGASDADIIPALSTYMRYSKAAKNYYRGWFSTSDWMNLIKAEIDANRPILYGGQDPTNGGHQFVCDGYDMSNNNVHINWGWSGSSNGWFTLDMSIKGSYKFNELQSALFDVEKDPQGTSVASPAVLSLEYYGGYSGYEAYKYKGLELASGSFAKGQKVTFTLGMITNNSASDYNGSVKLSIVSRTGAIKQDLVTVNLKLQAGYVGYLLSNQLQGTITTDLEFGDEIVAMYQQYGGAWAEFYYDHETAGCNTKRPVGGSFIDVQKEYASGDSVPLTLATIKTTSSIAWYLDGTRQKSVTSVKPASGTHTLKAVVTYSDSTTETFIQKFVVR